MQEKITTIDLSKFGRCGLEAARDLITAMMHTGLPDEFEDDEVVIMFNTHSGYVFLTNSEYQVTMLHDGMLEIYYTCGICGAEGFADEINWNNEWDCCGECL